MYESEYTKFMRELMQQKPQLEEEQRKGRAMWWDKSHDQARLREFREACVAQQPYVYQNKL
jgi:hypothetical protein